MVSNGENGSYCMGAKPSTVEAVGVDPGARPRAVEARELMAGGSSNINVCVVVGGPRQHH